MHFIQLFLKIINLLLQRLLFIELLIVFLLLCTRIRRHLRHFNIFIDNLLEHLCPHGEPVFLKDIVALLIVEAEHRG